MGLTEAKIKDLNDKKFDQLFAKHKAAWIKMVDVAYTHAKAHICGGGEPRPDDILKALQAPLEVSEDLRKHQEDVRARYKRFKEFFGEYIIDEYLREKVSMGKKI